jgi:hypothetical protein
MQDSQIDVQGSIDARTAQQMVGGLDEWMNNG